jgi:2-aminoethylphosphonate-pyruvate transaminase
VAPAVIKRAVILAAGMGTRLAGELDDRPKGFLQLGDRPIIEESIERLAGAGIRDVVIVTGHHAEFYESLEAGPGLDMDSGLSVRTVLNPRYADSGSMYSLYCAREAIAREAIEGGFLLLESDLIYEPRALTELLQHPAEDAILLSGPTGAGDEVYVSTHDGYLAGMSKNPDALGSDAEIAGELVGISKISGPLFRIMVRIAERAFAESLHYDYETDCLVAAGAERPVACPLVSDLVWAEIDDPSHLKRARDSVYPEIRRRVNAFGRCSDGTM